MRTGDWRDLLDRRHAAAVRDRHDVITQVRLDADEAGDGVAAAEVIEMIGQRQVGQAVAVVGQELRLVADVGARRP